MRLVLASGSPRRRDLLSSLGVPFEVRPSEVEERPPNAQEPPKEYALELARQKARAVAAASSDDVVLAADTVVAVDGQILGKPRDEADALRMLGVLRGRRHTVVTGVAVCCGGQLDSGAVTAEVEMRGFSDQEMREYVATGEPMDKAGAYAVQGQGGTLVDQVEGCLNTVIGLPLCLTVALLAGCGMTPAVSGKACCE